jgi:tetratricopeptide (TPR) repeat protein
MDQTFWKMGRCCIFGRYQGCIARFNRRIQSEFESIQNAIEIAKEYGILTFEAMVSGYLGAVRFWYGNWDEAITACHNCLDISQRIGNPLPMAWAIVFKGAALFNSGKAEDGLGAVAEAIRILSATNSVLAMRFLHAKLAEYLAISGDWEQAQIMDERASVRVGWVRGGAK